MTLLHDYCRVIPRDLFNEAKFLKGLGRLALLVHNGVLDLTINHTDYGPFAIAQDQLDGGLVCTNLEFSKNGSYVEVRSILNCRDSYNLVARVNDHEVIVFNDDGSLTDDFKEIVEEL